jgi:hypothetical protein
MPRRKARPGIQAQSGEPLSIAGGGLGLPIIGQLLGYAQVATTQRYVHLDADPLRRASEIIAGRIAAALDANGKAEVTPLPIAKPRTHR